jgi:hypothetical protein
MKFYFNIIDTLGGGCKLFIWKDKDNNDEGPMFCFVLLLAQMKTMKHKWKQTKINDDHE